MGAIVSRAVRGFGELLGIFTTQKPGPNPNMRDWEEELLRKKKKKSEKPANSSETSGKRKGTSSGAGSTASEIGADSGDDDESDGQGGPWAADSSETSGKRKGTSAGSTRNGMESDLNDDDESNAQGVPQAETTTSCNLVAAAHNQDVMQWKSPPRPKEWPTPEQYLRAKERIQDPDHRFFHFGFAGVVKAGKSSLLNSFRGLKPSDQGASKVDTVEVESGVRRFEYPGNKYPFIMYDIPGSGTHKVSAETYFNEQGLFAMDAIIIVVKDTFQQHDADLISRCKRLNIPTYVVRSRADQDIRSACEDSGGDVGDREAMRRAKEKYQITGRANIVQGLKELSLQDEKIYLVNARSMLRLVQQSWMQLGSDALALDEAELLKDLLEECKRRRLSVPVDEIENGDGQILLGWKPEWHAKYGSCGTALLDY